MLSHIALALRSIANHVRMNAILGVATTYTTPIFPTEIEHIIFMMAAEDVELPFSRFEDHQLALSLQLTARRVHYWVRPILSRLIQLLPDDDIPGVPDFERLPAFDFETLGVFVHHLSYGQSFSTRRRKWSFIDTLCQCPNVEDMLLFLHISQPVVFSALESSTCLKRLSAKLSRLTKKQMQDSRTFANLTHLGSLDPIDRPHLLMLSELKSLTHLALTNDMFWDQSFTDGVREILSPSGCVALRALVIYSPPIDVFDNRVVNMHNDLLDSRGALYWWISGVNGFDDVWDFADRIISARRRGYMRLVPNRPFNPYWFVVEEELTAEGCIWWNTLPVIDHDEASITY
ncbi:hypothetical protein BJ165DRAFT_1534595 [Panaeolus papilionaceus]|nr:hypothetical protein BJ165DRAFT_1534595 [Panaeolus papilionaceus]